MILKIKKIIAGCGSLFPILSTPFRKPETSLFFFLSMKNS